MRTGLLLVDSRFRGNDVWEGLGTPAARTRSPSNGLGIIRKHYTGKGCHPCVWASIGGFEVARLNVLEASCQNLFPAGSGVSVTYFAGYLYLRVQSDTYRGREVNSRMAFRLHTEGAATDPSAVLSIVDDPPDG